MKRREFIGLIGAAFLACAARAQQPLMPVIGFLVQSRTEFITLIVGAATTWPFAALTHQSGKVSIIGLPLLAQALNTKRVPVILDEANQGGFGHVNLPVQRNASTRCLVRRRSCDV